VVKNLPANARERRDTDLMPGLGRSPKVGNGNPLQYSCLKKLHGQRRLVDYSPWSHRKLDTMNKCTQTHIAHELLI